MLRKYCRTAATLRQKSGIADGKIKWEDMPVKIAVIDMTQRDIDAWGAFRYGKTVLIAPDVIPEHPAQIVIGGKTYDLKEIKVCRDLDGKLAGCRCLAVM